MSRYSILLKKTPEEIEKERSEKVVSFGLEQNVDFQKYQKTFFLSEGQQARVGIVFEDPKTLFFGSKIHFHNGIRFFCKSTSQRKAICCLYDYPGKIPTLRIATIIIVYTINSLEKMMSSRDSFKVIPWIFGKIMFNRIKELNTIWPVDKYDFGITLERTTSRFRSYIISSPPIVSPLYDPAVMLRNNEESLWQNSPMKNRILEIASFLRRSIKSYLAEDQSKLPRGQAPWL